MQYNQDVVRIVLGDTLLMDMGQPLPFDEKAASAYLKGRADVHGTVNIQVGRGLGRVKGQTAACRAALPRCTRQAKPRSAWLRLQPATG